MTGSRPLTVGIGASCPLDLVSGLVAGGHYVGPIHPLPDTPGVTQWWEIAGLSIPVSNQAGTGIVANISLALFVSSRLRWRQTLPLPQNTSFTVFSADFVNPIRMSTGQQLGLQLAVGDISGGGFPSPTGFRINSFQDSGTGDYQVGDGFLAGTAHYGKFGQA